MNSDCQDSVRSRSNFLVAFQLTDLVYLQTSAIGTPRLWRSANRIQAPNNLAALPMIRGKFCDIKTLNSLLSSLLAHEEFKYLYASTSKGTTT